MSLRLASLTAHLLDKPPDQPIDPLVQRINDTIKPPFAVTGDAVYIRAMYLVSDEVNSFGGCFPTDEHAALLPLLVDVPVMVGHRKDRLPIARTFHATIEQRDNHQWVKVLFYWLRETDGAESLAANIDGGLYKECSIGFVYRFPECSICGADIRGCDHEPLRRYDRNGSSVTAHYNYRRIERVLECSLVYRGAQPNTAVTPDISLADWHHPEPLDHTGADDLLLVTPAYDGIPVYLSSTDDDMRIVTCDATSLPDDTLDRFELPARFPRCIQTFGLIVGYRGRQRCSADDTRSFLAQQDSPVSRVELKLLLPESTRSGLSAPGPTHTVTPLRHRITTRSTLPETAAVLATRDGVRAWRLPQMPPLHPGYHYDPRCALKPRTSFHLRDHDTHQSLDIIHSDRTTTLELLGRPLSLSTADGTLPSIRKRGEAYLLELDGRPYLLRPVILHGRRRYLCHTQEAADASL